MKAFPSAFSVMPPSLPESTAKPEWLKASDTLIEPASPTRGSGKTQPGNASPAKALLSPISSKFASSPLSDLCQEALPLIIRYSVLFSSLHHLGAAHV